MRTQVTRSGIMRRLLSVLAFVILATATLAASRWQERLQVEANEEGLRREAAAMVTDIRDRLRLHAQFLFSLHAFASTPAGQQLANWRQFAAALNTDRHLNGLFAFAYAPAVRSEETGHFLKTIRVDQDRKNFHIFPLEAGQLAMPVTFIAAASPLPQAAIGFNLNAEPVRRQAIQYSLRSQDIALSGPIELTLADRQKHPGFLMVHALQRSTADGSREPAGVVLCAYLASEFFGSFQSAHDRLEMRVFEQAPDDESLQLIHGTAPDDATAGAAPFISHELGFGGRTWILHFWPRGASTVSGLGDPAELILYGGLTGSLLLALLLFHLSTYGERAERYAQSLNQELSQHRDHLQSLVEERTARLARALENATAADRAKSEFLANMSHELRTPMHAILSFAELGQLRLVAGQTDKLPGFLTRIEQSARRLLDLINDLLDLSKLEAGGTPFNLQPMDMLATLKEAIGQLESLLYEHQLQVDIDNTVADTRIHGDPARLLQVCCNLLSNAIKFSPNGGVLTIRISATTLPAGRRIDDTLEQPALQLDFRDQGPGIPPGELEHIFEKFAQSSATQTGAGGTGLGLAICREIVCLHHGTIAAQNNEGPGACFTLTLPTKWHNGLLAHD